MEPIALSITARAFWALVASVTSVWEIVVFTEVVVVPKTSATPPPVKEKPLVESSETAPVATSVSAIATSLL
ncbi:hypothetical protein D3C73_1374980 [compost metagenome]